MTHPYWPPFDIRIITPRLELRLLTDEDIPSLIEAAKSGIHDPDFMPFAHPWTDVPSPQFERNTAQFVWRSRGSLAPEDWHLPFGIFLVGRAIGVQAILAQNFGKTKLVSTGSWLAKEFHGKGYGKEMRLAVLFFAFEGLGAEVAESEALFGNDSSIGVSRAVGYEDNGFTRKVHPRGEGYVDSIRFRMTKEAWQSVPKPEIKLEGVDECLEMLGASTGASETGGQ